MFTKLLTAAFASPSAPCCHKPSTPCCIVLRDCCHKEAAKPSAKAPATKAVCTFHSPVVGKNGKLQKTGHHAIGPNRPACCPK